MKSADTLNFELSGEQEVVLGDCKAQSVLLKAETEGSYRAWNASFVSCDTPLEPSYRAWNASFISCDVGV